MKVITAVLRPDCVSADTRVAIPYSITQIVNLKLFITIVNNIKTCFEIDNE